MTPIHVDHVMMDAVQTGACPNQYLPAIDKEWMNPRHADFNDRNAWSLFNSFTQVNRDKTVHFEQQVPRTVALHKAFDEATFFEYKKQQLGLTFTT